MNDQWPRRSGSLPQREGGETDEDDDDDDRCVDWGDPSVTVVAFREDHLEVIHMSASRYHRDSADLGIHQVFRGTLSPVRVRSRGYDLEEK